MITQTQLKSLLSYDPETGVFVWLVSNTNSVSVGSLAGYLDKTNGYIQIGIDGKNYLAHRLTWLYIHGEFPPEFIDHINTIRNDNRLSNLRLASNAENLKNCGKYSTNTSGYKGIIKRSRMKADGNITIRWLARAKLNGKTHHIGTYLTKELASLGYQAFARLHHKEFYNSGE